VLPGEPCLEDELQRGHHVGDRNFQCTGSSSATWASRMAALMKSYVFSRSARCMPGASSSLICRSVRLRANWLVEGPSLCVAGDLPG
jgi:hypothetical protein